MADEVARLVAVMEAQLKGFTKGMDQAKALADRRLGQIETRMRQTERSFGAFGRNLNIAGLLRRFASWATAISLASRLNREATEASEEVRAALERQARAWDELGETASPTVALIQNSWAAILESINLAIRAQRAFAANNSRLLGGAAAAGAPFENRPFVADPMFQSARLDPRTKTWTPGAQGFPEPGIRDVTPKRPAAGTTAEPENLTEAINFAEALRDLEQQFMDTLHAEQEFRSEQYLIAKTLRDDSARAVEEARQELAELAAEAQQLEQERVADRITAIGDGFEYLGRAALEGADAFQRALQDMVASLAASGLRNLLEAGLNSIVDGGGWFGDLIAGRASGGPVTRGTPYVVGEKGPELFVPPQNGTIVPTPASPVAGYGGGTIELHQHMSLAANGDAQVAAIAQRAAAEGAAVAIKTVQRNFPNWMVKAQRNNL